MNSQPSHAFGIGDAIRFGWTTTKANLRPLLMLGLIGLFLTLLEDALRAPARSPGIAPLLALMVHLVHALVTMALLRVALRLHDGKPVDLYDREVFFTGFFGYLLTTFLVCLIVTAGLALLIVPGILWGARYAFAPMLAVDGRRHASDALRESARLTKGLRGQVVLFGLALFAVNLLGALALGVGLLVSIPTTCLAAAYVLRRLQVRDGSTSHVNPGEPAMIVPKGVFI